MRQSAHADEIHARLGIGADVFEYDATRSLRWYPALLLANPFARLLPLRGRHVVEQDRFGAAFQRFVQLAHGAHFNLDALSLLAPLQCTSESCAQPATQRNVVVLDQNARSQVEPMIGSAAAK